MIESLVLCIACSLVPKMECHTPAKDVAAAGKIKVKRQSEFSLQLSSGIRTGGRWKIAASVDPAMIKLLDRVYRQNDIDAPEQEAHETWVFRALDKKGETKITMIYVYPGEKDSIVPVASKEYIIQVD